MLKIMLKYCREKRKTNIDSNFSCFQTTVLVTREKHPRNYSSYWPRRPRHALTSLMMNWLATTETWSSGTLCATQIALFVVAKTTPKQAKNAVGLGHATFPLGPVPAPNGQRGNFRQEVHQERAR